MAKKILEGAFKAFVAIKEINNVWLKNTSEKELKGIEDKIVAKGL